MVGGCAVIGGVAVDVGVFGFSPVCCLGVCGLLSALAFSVFGSLACALRAVFWSVRGVPCCLELCDRSVFEVF